MRWCLLLLFCHMHRNFFTNGLLKQSFSGLYLLDHSQFQLLFPKIRPGSWQQRSKEQGVASELVSFHCFSFAVLCSMNGNSDSALSCLNFSSSLYCLWVTLSLYFELTKLELLFGDLICLQVVADFLKLEENLCTS